MDIKVYIIILNWNGWRDTIECLEAVFQNEYKNYKVIVCDNNSDNNSLDRIKEWAEGNRGHSSANKALAELTNPPVQKPINYIEYNRCQAEAGGNYHMPEPSLILIQTGDNLGFAGGNNVGIRYALSRSDFKYVWLLNNDTVIEKNALINLIKKSQSDSSIGMCGSKLYYYDRPEDVQAISGVYNKLLGTSKYNRSLKASKGIDYVVGASMFVSKQFLGEVGLLNEEYFLYYEELDWVMRAKGKFRLAYAVDSIVYHKEGATIGGGSDAGNKSEIADFYALRNRIVFTKRYFPLCLPLVYSGLIISILRRLKRKQYRRIKMIIDIILNPEDKYFRSK